MTLLVSSTVLSLLVGVAPTTVFISEVAYNVVNEGTDEWVELVNLSDGAVSLDELRVGDEESLGGNEAILRFPVGATMQPWSAVVVATNASSYFALQGRYPDFEVKGTVGSVAQMSFDRTLGGARFELANSTDEIVLLDATGLLIDGLSWGRTTPLAGMTNTTVTPKGKTIARRFSATDGPEPWRVGAPTPGVVVITGLSGAIPGEGESEPVDPGEGEGEGEPIDPGEGEGEGEGEPVESGEGEGEGETGEGEGETGQDDPDDTEPAEGNNPGTGVELGDRPTPPVLGPPEAASCSNGGGAVGSLGLMFLGWRRRRVR